MHPETAKSLTAQHRDELARHAADARQVHGRRLPRWHISWSRTLLSAAPADLAAFGGTERRRGSSWVIIISASRPALCGVPVPGMA